MPFPYKMITTGEKEIGRIAGNAAAHIDLITRDLTARYRHKLPEDQEVIDLEQLQRCIRDELRELQDEMIAIEREHMEEREADLMARLERDDSRPRLRESLIGIKGLIDSTYGAGSSSKVFGADVAFIPIDVFPLRRVGHVAYDRLTHRRFSFPTPRIPGVEIDPRALAESFKGHLDRLDRVLVGLDEETPVSNQSLEKKMRKLSEVQERVGVAARFLEALYHLGGHDVIAERVRLSSHRARRRAPSPAEEDAAADTASAAGAAPEDTGANGPADGFPFEEAAGGPNDPNTEGRPAAPAAS